jgi:hypothetical protein
MIYPQFRGFTTASLEEPSIGSKAVEWYKIQVGKITKEGK